MYNDQRELIQLNTQSNFLNLFDMNILIIKPYFEVYFKAKTSLNFEIQKKKLFKMKIKNNQLVVLPVSLLYFEIC